MVQRGAAVYEEGTHLQKLYYSFTYCILCHVNVVCAYNLFVHKLSMRSCQVERLTCLKVWQTLGQGWTSSSLIARRTCPCWDYRSRRMSCQPGTPTRTMRLCNSCVALLQSIYIMMDASFYFTPTVGSKRRISLGCMKLTIWCRRRTGWG